MDNTLFININARLLVSSKMEVLGPLFCIKVLISMFLKMYQYTGRPEIDLKYFTSEFCN